MNKVQSIKAKLDPILIKRIVDKYPSWEKPLTAYRYFVADLREAAKRKELGPFPELPKNFRPQSVNEIWHRTNPEVKRKYFIKERVHHMVFEAQRQLWLAEAGTLLKEHSEGTKNIPNESADDIKTRDELSSLIEEYSKDYERMIQAESTRNLYKYILDRSERLNEKVDPKTITSDLPSNLLPIVQHPRKPLPPFVLYYLDYKELLKKEKIDKNFSGKLTELAAVAWAELDECEKEIYRKRSERLSADYKKAMLKFERQNMSKGRNYLDLESSDKTAYKKSLGKKLRTYSITPKRARTGLAFFMKNHPWNLPVSCKKWLTLSAEEQEKYIEMFKEDLYRYYNEKSAYLEAVEKLDSLIESEKKSSSDK